MAVVLLVVRLCHEGCWLMSLKYVSPSSASASPTKTTMTRFGHSLAVRYSGGMFCLPTMYTVQHARPLVTRPMFVGFLCRPISPLGCPRTLFAVQFHARRLHIRLHGVLTFDLSFRARLFVSLVLPTWSGKISQSWGSVKTDLVGSWRVAISSLVHRVATEAATHVKDGCLSELLMRLLEIEIAAIPKAKELHWAISKLVLYCVPNDLL